MKKLLFLALVFFVGTLTAQVKPKHTVKPLTKADYVAFINKTNDIIKETWKIVQQTEVYTGALLVAKDMQKKSFDAFKNKELNKALTLSANAREFCYHAYVKNKQQPAPRDWHPGPKYRPFITKHFTKNEILNKLQQVNKEDEKNFSPNDLTDIDDNSKGKTQDEPNDNGDNSKGKTQQN